MVVKKVVRTKLFESTLLEQNMFEHFNRKVVRIKVITTEIVIVFAKS